MNYSYSEASVKIDGKVITFLSPIKDVLEIENLLLVILQRVGVVVHDSESRNSNIYAYDLNGNKLWQIQECPLKTKQNKPYTGLYIQLEDVIAYCSLGYECKVNLSDGSVELLGGRPW